MSLVRQCGLHTATVNRNLLTIVLWSPNLESRLITQLEVTTGHLSTFYAENVGGSATLATHPMALAKSVDFISFSVFEPDVFCSDVVQGRTCCPSSVSSADGSQAFLLRQGSAHRSGQMTRFSGISQT
ncbi:hypothetical protein RRG08_045182 [Elysia crispata]|uniref:Uncharacterized protein n=1 Tax=Elysia crispata TaxID=231223 RepID=A0AAE1DXR4_9GAST|nr:hypothetical protein RRG08_045182 [Elysia crispata]